MRGTGSDHLQHCSKAAKTSAPTRRRARLVDSSRGSMSACTSGAPFEVAPEPARSQLLRVARLWVLPPRHRQISNACQHRSQNGAVKLANTDDMRLMQKAVAVKFAT